MRDLNAQIVDAEERCIGMFGFSRFSSSQVDYATNVYITTSLQPIPDASHVYFFLDTLSAKISTLRQPGTVTCRSPVLRRFLSSPPFSGETGQQLRKVHEPVGRLDILERDYPSGLLSKCPHG